MSFDLGLQKEVLQSIKCKNFEDPRISRNKIHLRDVNSLKWTSQKGEEKHKISLNPMNQTHPSIYFREPPSDLPSLRRDIWDSALYETKKLLRDSRNEKIQAGVTSLREDAEVVKEGGYDHGSKFILKDPKLSQRDKSGSIRISHEAKVSHHGGLKSVLRGSDGQNYSGREVDKSWKELNQKDLQRDTRGSGSNKSDVISNSGKAGNLLSGIDLTRFYCEPTLPLAAVNMKYEDPYSSQHAETKLLAGKAVNFFVCSRSHFNTRQLAKKMALEINCLLIDPMEILESYYRRTSKGFFIPRKIIGALQQYLCQKFSTDLCGTLCILRSLMTYFDAQSNGMDDRCRDIAAQKISIDDNVENISNSLPRSRQSSRKSNLFSKGSVSSSKNQRDSRNEDKVSTKEGSPSRTEDPNVDNHPIVCFLKKEMKRSSCIGDIVDSLGDLPTVEAEQIIDYILSLEASLFSRVDISAHLRPLSKGIAKKNLADIQTVLKEEIMRAVESFDAYTRGYVLVYDPSVTEKNQDIWTTVFSSLNPPDVVIFGQCPVDELNTTFEVLRVNPFLPYEYYHYEFRQNLRHKCSIYADALGLEENEVLNYINHFFRDRNVPIDESLVYEYYEIIHRRQFLCQLSEVCLAIKSSPLPENIGEGFHESYFGESFGYKQKEDPDNIILNLENYVKLPKEITSFTDKFNEAFNIDSLLMTAALNCHSTCVVRTDVRTPISYQYSIVKRWFDYSGFHPKPRARCGNLAKLSIMCELIGRGIEQRKLNDEFLMEYNEKINAAKQPGFDEGEDYMEDVEIELFNHEEEEKSAYVEDEAFQNEWLDEGLFNASTVVSTAKSSTIKTLSEFDSINRANRDEFYYLHQDFEDKFSFLVDLQELNSRDNPLFFQTYQCNFTVWEDRCPVAHYEGKCRLGFPEFAVRLHDKVYFMSTLQAMKAFMYQPAKHLLPLLPASHCSILVVGKPMPAKTYLSEAIATFFGASVIDYNSVIAKAQEELKNIYLQSATDEVIELLKCVFSENVSSDYKKECDYLVDWLDKSYQLILFRKLIFKPLYWNIYPPELYDEPDGEMFSISEFYPSKNSLFDLNRLCKRGQIKDLIMDIFFKTFQKYSDYMNIEPYFLKGCPEEVLNYDILLDTLLREQFKNMGLIDIYGNYDMCDLYAWYPYRLLERLPLDLIPRQEPMTLEEDAKIRNDIVQFLFPLNSVPLSVREKIDALGTEIVSIERKARLLEQISYGGWVINGLPINEKLFNGLNKAGIFPRNVIYIDDPDLFYLQFENMHLNEVDRMSDIEKNLVCYVSPKLRTEILPLSNKLPQLLDGNKKDMKLTDKLIEEEFIQNLGCKVARTYEKFQAFLRLNYASIKNKCLPDWPGEKGLKTQLGRNNLYDSINNHPDYGHISDLGFQKELDLFELIYTKYARSYFKPLNSFAAIHVITASRYRSFLYHSKKIRKNKIRNRIFKLIDSFFQVVQEDAYFSECIKFVSFKFYHEEINIPSSPTKVPQISMNFSYLYHLAYAIENSMFMCDNLNQIFKQIYTILKNLGFSLGIEREYMPKSIEISHSTWEEKDKNRQLLHIEKRLRIHSKIIDYEYIMSKILELEKKKKSSSKESRSGSNISVERNSDISDHCYTHSQSLSTLRSNENKVQNMGIKALRTLLEYDSSYLITTNDEYSKFILYFPQNLSFMLDQEKAYDMCLITNKKFHNSQDICDKDYDLNTLLILFEDDVWDDWKFVQAEDYGDLQSFWGRKNSKDFNLMSQLNNPFEKISKEKGFHFLKKVVSIQSRIDFLRKRKDEFLCSDEEQLLLDYLIWIRNEYFRRYLIGVVDLPSEVIKAQPIESKLPNISLFCSKLTKDNDSTKSTKINIEYETWPFRSNYKSLPRFIGIYDCILWNELSEIRMKKQKFVINLPKLSLHTEQSSCSQVLDIASELKNDLVNEMTDFILNYLNSFKIWDFNIELSKMKNAKNLNFGSLFLKCFFGGNKQIKGMEARKSNKKELFFKNEFILNENNSSKKYSKKKNSLQKDGPKNYRPIVKNVFPIKEAVKTKESIEEVKMFVLDSSVVSKINWISIDDLGPFNVLYTILNSIRGSRGLPKVTGTTLPIEKETIPKASDEGIFQSTIEEEEIKIRGAKEKICIVCLFNNEIKYGLEGLSVELLGQTFNFCSQKCFVKFRLSSELYVNILKTLENIIPFYIFYLELPGGVGRNVCSLLSYYFEINMFYMDDYLLQRYRTKNIDNDIKFVSIKKKLVTCFNSEHNKKIENNENFLWSYLIQESEVPRLPKLIENCWKKEKHFCIYNFPHHPNSLNQTAKKCFIPNIIIKSSINSLKKMMEFKNVDFIKCYAADLYNDKNRITKLYFLDFKWWMSNWQARFLKIFKIIKREEIFNLISSLQFNLTTSLKPITIDRFGIVNPITPPVPLELWSGVSFPFYEKSEAQASKNESSEILINFPTKLKKSFGGRDNRSRESIFDCKEPSDSEMSKVRTGNDITNFYEDKYKSETPLKSTRLVLPNKLKWKTNFKESFEYQELKHLTDKHSYKKLCQNVKNQLQREIINELLFRENIKQTVCSKKAFSDEEINLKSEVLSVDSIGFEDYDNIKIEYEDLKKDNALRTLTIALKHANSSNPIPAPTLDRFYEDAKTHDLNIFSDCQIQAYEATVNQFQSLFDGVENPSFDILKDNFESLIRNIKQAKKQTLYSECVIEIDKNDVEKLLETGYYFLSKFGRLCPVQSRRGFLYPISTIMYDSSNCYPVVHRRYMYFLGSKSALQAFKDGPLEFVDEAEYNPPIPIKAIFFGPNTKRTKYIISYLAKEYSLEHISVSRALEHFIRSGSWTRLGQRLKWQSSYVYGLPFPVKLPTSIVWQAVLSSISSPKSASHGFIISGLMPSADLIQIWNQCHFKPHVIFYMTVDNSDLVADQQRQGIVCNFDSMGHKVRHFEFVKNSYMMNILGCTNNEINTWETCSNSICIAYIKKYYSNVNILNYYSSIQSLCCGMSSALLGSIKQIRSFYNLSINGNEDPIPVGNLISFKHYKTLRNDIWGNSCPVCVCTSGRYLQNYPKFFQSGIILRKGKSYWVCQKHTAAFISSPEEYTSNFDFKLQLSTERSENKILPSEITFEFNGFCPVCYWVQKPHLEYQYRCGSSKFLQFYQNKAYKFCSAFCLAEFISAPWLYAFVGKCKVESNIMPHVDTKYWSEFDMKKFHDNYIYLRDVKGIFFYNLMRLAANLKVISPGLSKRETRLFFIYALARRYIAGTMEANNWKQVIVEFLLQYGVSKKMINKFLYAEEKDMEITNMIEYFASFMTI